jgi:hypothetical protein
MNPERVVMAITICIQMLFYYYPALNLNDVFRKFDRLLARVGGDTVPIFTNDDPWEC